MVQSTFNQIRSLIPTNKLSPKFSPKESIKKVLNKLSKDPKNQSSSIKKEKFTENYYNYYKNPKKRR